MNDTIKNNALRDNDLENVSGGAVNPGAVMVCVSNAPIYGSNPAGNHFRTTVKPADTIPAGSTVKVFEYGTQYSRVVSNGKTGWIETALLANK